MSNTLKPSQVDTSGHLIGSSLRMHQLEVVAFGIVELEQAKAFAADRDEWLPFRTGEYDLYTYNPEVPPLFNHRKAIRHFRQEGLLRIGFDGLVVTDRFLDVLVDFRRPEAAVDPAA